MTTEALFNNRTKNIKENFMNDKEITYNIDLYLETIQDKIKEKKSYERSLFAGLSIVTLFNVFVLLIRNPIAGLLVELLILAFFCHFKISV